jgi:hypothetical protein
MESRTVRNNIFQAQTSVATAQRVSTLKTDIAVPSGGVTRAGSAQLRASARLIYSPPAKRLTFPAQTKTCSRWRWASPTQAAVSRRSATSRTVTT